MSSLMKLPIVAELTQRILISSWENNPEARNYYLQKKRREIALAIYLRAPKGVLVALRIDETGPVKEREAAEILHSFSLLNTEQPWMPDEETPSHDVYTFRARLYDLGPWIAHMEEHDIWQLIKAYEVHG